MTIVLLFLRVEIKWRTNNKCDDDDDDVLILTQPTNPKPPVHYSCIFNSYELGWRLYNNMLSLLMVALINFLCAL